jgi:hypothetical protein
VAVLDDFVFCGCCFFHFGNDDNAPEPLMNARRLWFQNGLPFKDNIGEINMRPWTLEMAINQLERLKFVDTSLWPNFVMKINSNWTADFDVQEVEDFWKNGSSI